MSLPTLDQIRDQRVRIFRIDTRLVLDMMKGVVLGDNKRVAIDGLPKDAHVININIDHLTGCNFCVLIESEEFELRELNQSPLFIDVTPRLIENSNIDRCPHCERLIG